MDDAVRVRVESRTAWRSWLKKNHGNSNGIRFYTFKKHCGDKDISYNTVVEEALGFFESARQSFEVFPRSAKRGILEWIAAVKRPQTRAGRVQETARLAVKNIRACQWPR
jgi:uncharacterized protein YdeI (YjbR/CyaY-like superfamily)